MYIPVYHMKYECDVTLVHSCQNQYWNYRGHACLGLQHVLILNTDWSKQIRALSSLKNTVSCMLVVGHVIVFRDFVGW